MQFPLFGARWTCAGPPCATIRETMPCFPSLPQSVFLVSLALSSALFAQDSPKPDASKTDSPATIAQKTAAMKHLDGFVPLDWDAKTGKLYLEIPRFNSD